MSFKMPLMQCRAAVMLFCLGSVVAQTPAFEVAVIKPSLPMAQALPLLMQGKMRAGISIDKARVDMEFVTLSELIGKAYNVKPYQISGPDWLLVERFDIQAKLPEGIGEERVAGMLETLLAERFGLITHMELRTVSAYALIVGKNGAKLRQSTLPDDPQPGNGLNTMSASPNGTLTASGSPAGPTRMTMGPDGIQLVMMRTKVQALADMLAVILGRPVVDRTGLTGNYQITLDLPQEDVRNVARALGMGGPAAGGVPSEPGGGSMFGAVEKPGLKLDSRTEQIETLVIDHIEKTPSGN